MNKDKLSKGVWDEPIPDDIADAISTNTPVGNVPNIEKPPEFNPAFNSSLLTAHKREKPVVRESKHLQQPSDVISQDPSPYIPQKNSQPPGDSVEVSEELTDPEQTDQAQKSKVSPSPSSDTHTQSFDEPISNLGRKSLFGNMDKFSKPKIIRASIKSVFPHIFLCVLCVLLALFPSLAINFLGEDLQAMPDTIVENMPVIVGVFFFLIAVFILVIMAKQLATGSLWLYEGHIKFKKGLLESETHYYGNLQTVEAERTLSSMWSDTGDLVLLHPKGSITMHNVLHPFLIRDEMREQIKHHRNK